MPPIGSVQDIPQRLIEARIRAGLTQEELAQKIGLKPQQLQRYEATDYNSASLARVAEIAEFQCRLGRQGAAASAFLIAWYAQATQDGGTLSSVRYKSTPS